MNMFNQLILNKILKNLDLDSIKLCSLVNKQFNKAFNVDMLWHNLFISHYDESVDEYKKLFDADSYKDTYKKYISLQYFKKTLNLNYTIIELASLKSLDFLFLMELMLNCYGIKITLVMMLDFLFLLELMLNFYYTNLSFLMMLILLLYNLGLMFF